MGNSSSMLTQYDIEEVQEHAGQTFSQQEIVSLYQRFCQLDRNGCGFISGEEFMTVPEFAVNPLSQRLFRMLDGLNFKEFVAFLSAFGSRASLQQKVEFIFKVYDSDGNGKVTFNEMLDILRDLTGQFISEQQREFDRELSEELRKKRQLHTRIKELVSRTQHNELLLTLDGWIESFRVVTVCRLKVLAQVLDEAGYTKDSVLVQADFMKILGNSGLKMEVEVPID